MEINSGKSPKNLISENGSIPYYKVEQLNNCNKYQIETPYFIEKSEKIIPKGSIIFPKRGAAILLNKIRILSKDSFMDTNLMTLTVDNANDNEFIYYFIQKEDLSKIADTTSIPQLNNKHINPYDIFLPSKKEQEKISNFIGKIDKKIELLEKKCNLIKEHKSGFIQKLRKQEIKFRSNGKNYPKWEEVPLKDILYEHKLKSAGNEEVYSVSVHKGVVNQVEHLGRSFATDDLSKYKLVKPGDIVYTKSPTAGFELGIIKQNKNDKNVLVSPLYGVFSPKNVYLGNYLDAYFESSINTRNYLHPIVQKGAKNTMNITNKVFLSRSILLPVDYEEQKKISDYIDLINRKYDDTYNLYENMKEMKKGLLQKMFV